MVQTSTTIQPKGGIGALPPYLVISKNEILGVFRTFIQRYKVAFNNYLDENRWVAGQQNVVNCYLQ